MRFLRRNKAVGDRPIENYDDADVAALVVRKTEAVRRLSRIEDVIPGESLLPTLLGVAATAGDRVLDFGGAAGLHYLVAKQAFPARRFRWAVVETPLMVGAAVHLANAELQFFPTAAAAAAWLGGVDLLHSIGAVPYLAEPERQIAELLALKPRSALWAKTFTGERRTTERQEARLGAHGPGPSRDANADRMIVYQTVRLDEHDFLAQHRAYRLAWRGADAFLFLS